MAKPKEFAQCPRCKRNVALDKNGSFAGHTGNDGRPCPWSNKQPPNSW
jgi:hypothetical protein